MKNSQMTSWLKSRPLMFTASSVWVALILVIFVFRGGGTAPLEPRPVPPALSLAQQAEALLAQGEYQGAWGFYYQALQAAPEDVSLWYGLGVVLSHLNHKEQAGEAFQHVVRRGRPDSQEVRLARRWLVSARVLTETLTSAVSPATEPAVSSSKEGSIQLPSPATSPVAGRVRGRTDARRGIQQINLALAGDEDSNREIAFAKSVKPGEPYEFANVPPGTYRLTGEDPEAETQLWDVRVTVTVGKETILDLTNASTPIAARSR